MRKKLLIALALFSQVSTFAQDTTAVLDEVIVTANRFPQKQSQIGKTVSVIGKDVLDRNRAQSVAYVLNQQVGITVNGALNNPGTNQTVFFRGANRGRVLVLINGIPMGDPSDIDNTYNLNLISLLDVERIEILRGNQSTLYGSDAVAGVINIITTKNSIQKPFQLRSTLSAGGFNTLKGNIQIFGNQSKFNYQASYTKNNTKGFSSATDSAGNKNFDTDGYKADILNANITYQITPILKLTGYSGFTEEKSEIDYSAFTDDLDHSIQNKSFTTGIGFQLKKDWFTLTGNYNYTDYQRIDLNDSTDLSGYVKREFFSKSQYVELYSSINLSKSISIIQGADLRYGSYNSNSLFGNYPEIFKDTNVSQTSMYSSLLYSSKNNRLHMELGGRLNVHSRYGFNNTYTFNPSYIINKQIRFFGSISTAFKAPSLYQLYGAYGDKELLPENSINYEIGMDQQSNKIKQSLVYFYREVKQGIDYDNINYVYYNFQKQMVRGLEYEAALAITPSLSTQINYTYLNGSELSQSRITFNDTTYNFLLRRPSHTGNIRVNYRPNQKWQTSLGAKFVSERYDVGDYQEADVKLDSYYIISLYGEYKIHSNVMLFLDLQNLTNNTFHDLRGYNSMPFMANGGIVLKY